MADYYVLTQNDILVGVTPENPYMMALPEDISISEFVGSIPDLNEYEWDPIEGVFVHSTSVFSKLEFLLKFTPAELDLIRSSTDANVKDIIEYYRAATYVSITDSTTIDSVAYLVSVSILASNRMSQILSV